MRLFRPAPRTRSMASIGAMSRVRATAAASASPGSAMSTEQHLGDLLPARTHLSGAKRPGRRKQDRKHTRRESRIAEHLLQVIDEMRATECTDPLELRRARALEEYALDRNAEAVAAKKTSPRHPVERRSAQIDAPRVVMAELRLVADDEHIETFGAALAQKHVRPVEHRGAADASTVDVALKKLPRKLAVR